MSMVQRGKSGRRMKQSIASSSMGSRETRQMILKSHPEETPEAEGGAKKKVLGARKKKIDRSTKKKTLNRVISEESDYSVPSGGGRISQMGWGNKTIEANIMAINQEPVGLANVWHPASNKPKTLNKDYVRAKVDSGIGHVSGTMYPRPEYPIASTGINRLRSRQPTGFNVMGRGKSVPQPGTTESNPFRHRDETNDTSRKIDSLVTALASLIPPCKSNSQLEMVVGSFANALKEKVSVTMDAQRQKFPAAKPTSADTHGNNTVPSHPSTLMNPTESWVARCRSIETERRLNEALGSTIPKTKQVYPRPGSTSIQAQTSNVSRKFGSTRIQESDTEEEDAKSAEYYNDHQEIRVSRFKNVDDMRPTPGIRKPPASIRK